VVRGWGDDVAVLTFDIEAREHIAAAVYQPAVATRERLDTQQVVVVPTGPRFGLDCKQRLSAIRETRKRGSTLLAFPFIGINIQDK
jgi:hypothetical protein